MVFKSYMCDRYYGKLLGMGKYRKRKKTKLYICASIKNDEYMSGRGQ